MSKHEHAEEDSNDCPSVLDLPFVQKDPYSMWAIPADLAPEDAIPTGYRWGDQFARFLMESPFYAGSGLLHGVVRDINASQDEISRHCAIAFFSRIEEVLRTGASALVGLPYAEFRNYVPIDRSPSN